MMKRFSLLILLVMFVGSFSLAQAGDRLPTPSDAPAQEAGGPAVVQVPLDFGVVGGYRYMRVVTPNARVYNRPGGQVLYQFEGGYDFVTPRNQEGSWIEINPGEWMHQRHLQEVYASQFRGVLLQGEPAVPFGWILVTHYASAEPGGAEVQDAAFRVTRYTVTNLYNAVDVGGWRWYDIGGGRWVKQTMVGKVQRVGNPGVGGRWVAVDLYEQTLVAYEGDAMIFATLISSGLPGNDTNAGVFNIWAKNANKPMDGTSGGYGNYRLENVPYAMYFDGDISLHGTYWHNGFGYRQSRGCVNLSIADARWLFDWLGDSNAVYVYYSQSY